LDCPNSAHSPRKTVSNGWYARSLRDHLKRKAKEKIEQHPADKGDKSEKSDKSEKARPTTDADSSVAPAEPEASATANDPPGKGAWLNYDFIPRHRRGATRDQGLRRHEAGRQD
jgi:hypothetical protein